MWHAAQATRSDRRSSVNDVGARASRPTDYSVVFTRALLKADARVMWCDQCSEPQRMRGDSGGARGKTAGPARNGTNYPAISAAYWLPPSNPTPYHVPGSRNTGMLTACRTASSAKFDLTMLQGSLLTWLKMWIWIIKLRIVGLMRKLTLLFTLKTSLFQCKCYLNHWNHKRSHNKSAECYLRLSW